MVDCEGAQLASYYHEQKREGFTVCKEWLELILLKNKQPFKLITKRRKPGSAAHSYTLKVATASVGTTLVEQMLG